MQAGEGPQQREHDRGDRKPAPQPHARQTEGRRGDDGEIDIERPEVRFAGGNQDRRDEGAGDAEAGERRPVQQRRGERAQRHQPEQDEGGGRHQESVQRIGRIDRCKRHRGAGGGENRRDIGDRQRLDGGDALLAPGPFAGGKQRQREQAAEHGAHAGAEQAGLDRIAHHEEAAERQRQSADPHHPAGADRFLETGIGLRQAAAARLAGSQAARRRLGWRRGRCDRFYAGDDGRRLWRDLGRGRRRGLFERLLACSGGGTGLPRHRRRALHHIQPRAQRRNLVHRLARDDKRDNRNRRSRRKSNG